MEMETAEDGLILPETRALRARRRAQQTFNQVLTVVGLTILLGFGGGLALVAGKRRLAALAWVCLGAGSIGAAFDSATKGDLRLNKIDFDSKQQAFLATHLPFLVLGLLLWFGWGDKTCRSLSTES